MSSSSSSAAGSSTGKDTKMKPPLSKSRNDYHQSAASIETISDAGSQTSVPTKVIPLSELVQSHSSPQRSRRMRSQSPDSDDASTTRTARDSLTDGQKRRERSSSTKPRPPPKSDSTSETDSSRAHNHRSIRDNGDRRESIDRSGNYEKRKALRQESNRSSQGGGGSRRESERLDSLDKALPPHPPSRAKKLSIKIPGRHIESDAGDSNSDDRRTQSRRDDEDDGRTIAEMDDDSRWRSSRSRKRSQSPFSKTRDISPTDEEGKGGKKSKTKIKISSPVTGATITLGHNDLLIPSKRRTRNPSQTPSLSATSQGHSEAGTEELIRSKLRSGAVPGIAPRDHVLTEKEEEEERIRALLSSTAAVKGISRATGHGRARRGAIAAVSIMDEEEGEARAPVLEMGEPEVLFYDDGGKFRQFYKTTGEIVDIEMDSQELFDTQLRSLCWSVDTNASFVLNAGHGMYAGACLLSLIIFPIYASLDINSAFCLYFITFYSPFAASTSRLFSCLGTFAVLSTMTGEPGVPAQPKLRDDGGGHLPHHHHHHRKWWHSHDHSRSDRSWFVEAVRWWRRRSRRAMVLTTILAFLCATFSYLATTMMIPVDDRLFESQALPYGGYYGDVEWFTNSSLTNPFLLINETMAFPNVTNVKNQTILVPIHELQNDLNMWATLNGARSILGFFAWVLSCLAQRVSEKNPLKMLLSRAVPPSKNSGTGANSVKKGNRGKLES